MTQQYWQKSVYVNVYVFWMVGGSILTRHNEAETCPSKSSQVRGVQGRHVTYV